VLNIVVLIISAQLCNARILRLATSRSGIFWFDPAAAPNRYPCKRERTYFVMFRVFKKNHC
jgi:hypothetical protein